MSRLADIALCIESDALDKLVEGIPDVTSMLKEKKNSSAFVAEKRSSGKNPKDLLLFSWKMEKITDEWRELRETLSFGSHNAISDKSFKLLIVYYDGNEDVYGELLEDTFELCIKKNISYTANQQHHLL